MRHLTALLATVALIACGPAAAASSATTDYSDLWWNPAEAGWGAHVTLQDNVVFMVLYVYDGQRRPRFFVAPDMGRAPSGETYEGALYRTSGPPFAGAFNPQQVSVGTAGTARLTFTSAGAGTLQYSVDGATVTKAISRQGWRNPQLAGDYRGGIFGTSTGSCPFGLTSIAYAGTLAVKQSGDTLTIESNVSPGFADSGTCRMSGRLVQQGSLASITGGTYSCEFTNEITASGTFDATGLEPGENGFGGRIVMREGASCVHSAYLGGIRQGYAILQPDPVP